MLHYPEAHVNANEDETQLINLNRQVRRIRARWKRGLHFRIDRDYCLYLVAYTDSVDPEGTA